MSSKSERTTQYILEKVAPVFNKHGYAGTSLAQITEATGMTKGAVYGNFENKENLALKAFNYSIRKLNKLLAEVLDSEQNPKLKLKALFEFYRGYPQLSENYGGCPILNIATDSNHQNEVLLNRAQQVIHKMKERLSWIIEDGVKQGEFREDLDSYKYASIIFSQIEGSVFLSSVTNEPVHMKYTMDHLDFMIDNEMS